MDIDMEFVMQAASAALGLCGVALLIASWLKREKSGADWAMAIGATFSLCGAIGLILAIAGLNDFQSDRMGFIVVGCGTMGVVLFTMGYVVDRITDRQTKDQNDFLNQVRPPQ